MLWKRGKAYPQELRDRVLVAADEGGRVNQIARRFEVSRKRRDPDTLRAAFRL